MYGVASGAMRASRAVEDALVDLSKHICRSTSVAAHPWQHTCGSTSVAAHLWPRIRGSTSVAAHLWQVSAGVCRDARVGAECTRTVNNGH